MYRFYCLGCIRLQFTVGYEIIRIVSNVQSPNATPGHISNKGG
jgi:hypothetical protein